MTLGKFRYQGYELGYEVHGAGELTIVLTSGLLLDAGVNRQLARSLSAHGCRVVLLNLLGHGASDKPQASIAVQRRIPSSSRESASSQYAASTSRPGLPLQHRRVEAGEHRPHAGVVEGARHHLAAALVREAEPHHDALPADLDEPTGMARAEGLESGGEAVGDGGHVREHARGAS